MPLPNAEGWVCEIRRSDVLNELSGNIAGLRYDSKGRMTPLAGSSESLSTPGADGVSTQVSFNPRGTVLTVTERFQDRIDTFVLGADGTPGPAIPNDSNAPTPFGFAYDGRGRLISSNAGPRFTFEGSGSSYRVTGSGALASIDNEASDGVATCWVAVTGNGNYSFMTNTCSGTVSRFRLANDGGLTLLGTTPTAPGLPGRCGAQPQFPIPLRAELVVDPGRYGQHQCLPGRLRR